MPHRHLVPSDKEALSLVDALAQLTFVVQGVLGRIATAHELSITQARLLGVLRDRCPTINDLAGLLQIDKSSVTGLVDRAEDRGLVQRTASTLDRRSVRVSITTAGEALVGEAIAAFEGEMEILVAGLSPTQRTRLATSANRIVKGDWLRRGIDVTVGDRS
jgi:MarR family transcriptional regulator, lower aerobic nicotinate degradation pathway regulator